MDLKELKIEYKDISTLVPYQNNARTHSQEQVDEIVNSINRRGWTNPILTDGQNGIIAGHGRLLAAQKLGLKRVPTIDLSFASDADKAEYIIADNKLALNAGWDFDILKGQFDLLADAGLDLLNTGFGEDEIKEIRNVNTFTEGLCDEDDVPSVAALPITQLGDVWLLGNHRLMCGDSTMVDQVEKLMNGEKADMVFTDPPYGVNYTGGAKKREALAGDQLGTEIYGQALPNLQIVAADHAALYLWYADAHASSAAAAAAAAAAGYEISAQIIWVKNNAQFVSAAKYHGKHEPCFYAHRKGKSAQWFGENNEVTVWEIDRNHKNEFHPTQKPTALAERAIGNSSKSGNIVLDLFGGSGTTLIACEKTNRKCFMMELAPNYCDVIIKRWQKFTGKQAILESSIDLSNYKLGTSFDEVTNGAAII